MSITVRVHKRTESVFLEIDDLQKCHEKNIKYALHNIGVILGREIERILTTGARTGHQAQGTAGNVRIAGGLQPGGDHRQQAAAAKREGHSHRPAAQGREIAAQKEGG